MKKFAYFDRIFLDCVKKTNFPKFVNIVDVTARDGLQNEKTLIEPSEKITLINQLVDTGLKNVEAGSFVSPKWVPQMKGTDFIIQSLNETYKDQNINFPVLVPNLKGLEQAIANDVKEIAIFASASEGFSQKNINCSVDESFKRFEELFKKKPSNIKVRGYVSVISQCPYDGVTEPQRVIDVSKRLLDIGCYEVSLGDTTGQGTPVTTKNLFEQFLKQHFPMEKLAMHFHDTYDTAIPNIIEGLKFGINTIDSSTGGVGGCPYAKNAKGNVSTENVLFLLNCFNIETGVDRQKIKSIGKDLNKKLNREYLEF